MTSKYLKVTLSLILVFALVFSLSSSASAVALVDDLTVAGLLALWSSMGIKFAFDGLSQQQILDGIRSSISSSGATISSSSGVIWQSNGILYVPAWVRNTASVVADYWYDLFTCGSGDIIAPSTEIIGGSASNPVHFGRGYYVDRYTPITISGNPSVFYVTDNFTSGNFSVSDGAYQIGNYRWAFSNAIIAVYDTSCNEYAFWSGRWNPSTSQFTPSSGRVTFYTELYNLMMTTIQTGGSLSVSDLPSFPVASYSDPAYVTAIGSSFSESSAVSDIIGSVVQSSDSFLSVPDFTVNPDLSDAIGVNETGILSSIYTGVNSLVSGVGALVSDLVGFAASLPAYLASFSGKFLSIWHYVIDWVASLGSWLNTMFSIWSGLPSAMVLPVYATAVIVIVLGMYKRFFL